MRMWGDRSEGRRLWCLALDSQTPNTQDCHHQTIWKNFMFPEETPWFLACSTMKWNLEKKNTTVFWNKK
jgi:hypothetical protein